MLAWFPTCIFFCFLFYALCCHYSPASLPCMFLLLFSLLLASSKFRQFWIGKYILLRGPAILTLIILRTGEIVPALANQGLTIFSCPLEKRIGKSPRAVPTRREIAMAARRQHLPLPA